MLSCAYYISLCILRTLSSLFVPSCVSYERDANYSQILIDFNTKTGFENIAEARQLLLDLGRKDQEDSASEHFSVRGSHVVAPVSYPLPLGVLV